MATDLEQKPKAATPKFESFVEQQIGRVRGRVRAQDAGKALLLFLIFTLAYGLGMALADRAWELSPLLRLTAFGVFALVVGVLVGWTLLCLIRRVNPYYAARQLEQTLPDAKNSLVNWLDLRDEKLPPVIHNALGLRAARDLKKADPEQAVNAGPTWILGGILGGLLLALLVLFIMGPQQFASLMNRTFFPFREGRIDTRTRIILLVPEAGNATVPPNRAIAFRARIDGPVPAVNQEGAPKILWRYNVTDPFVAQPLDKELDDAWTWTMPADEVINGGFWYKLTAGDTATPEYQVRVSAIPQVRALDVSYHYRPFERKAEDRIRYPKAVFSKLHARLGTEVTLQVQTNCDVREGHLQIDWEKKGRVDLPAQVLPDDLGTMLFPKFVLEAPGAFRIVFTSRDAKTNIDQSPYPISIFEEKPTVEILKPGKNVTLPANGTLQLEGFAGTTVGVKGMTLRMKVAEGRDKPELEPKPYRPGKSFKLIDGSYPPVLDYKDFVALDNLKTAKRQPFPLAAGMKLEYWLEAVDNSDYPDPNGNIGESKKFKVTIVDPEKDQKKEKQDRETAQQGQKQHEKKQDKEIEQRNKDAKEEQERANNQSNKNENKKQEQEAKGRAKGIQDKLDKQNPDPKQPPDPKEKQNPSQDPNANQGNQPQPNDQQPPKAGEGKGTDRPEADSKPGESDKQAPQPQQKDDKKSGQEKSSEKKDGGKDGGDKQPGQSKDDGQNAGDNGQKKGDEKPGETKDAGKKNPDAGAQGTGKKDYAGDKKEQTAGTKPGSTKEDGGQAQKKSEGGPGQEQQVSQAKKGPVDETQKVKGLAKGSDETPEKTAKSGEKGDQSNPPQAKNSNPGPRPSETKNSDANQTQNAAHSKEKAPANGEKNGPHGTEKFKEPTPEDIARLAKDLKSADPKKQQDAEKQLRRICDECQNPGSGKAADKALTENNRAPMKAKSSEGSGEKTAEQKDQGEDKQGDATKGQAKNAPPDAEQGKGKGKGQDDPNRGGVAQSKGGMMKPGSWGGGTDGPKFEGKASAPHDEYSKRGANLTLEECRKLLKTTAEERKKAGITEKEWQKFAKAMQEYEKDLRKRNVQASAKEGSLVGGNSQLGSTGPAQLKANSNRTLDPLDYSRALPPPEFREAQRTFTESAAQDKKK